MMLVTIEELKQAAQQIWKLTTGAKPDSRVDLARTYLNLIINDGEIKTRAEQFGVAYEVVIKSQCLYALSNLSHWRHPRAKQLRAVLKAFSSDL